MVFIYDCTDNAHCYFNGLDDALSGGLGDLGEYHWRYLAYCRYYSRSSPDAASNFSRTFQLGCENDLYWYCCIWFLRFSIAHLAIIGSERLPFDLSQNRYNYYADGRDIFCCTNNSDARLDLIYPWWRTRNFRTCIALYLYCDSLWSHIGISRYYRNRDNTQNDR
ncbi:hypothetical protein D3C72_837970 [compost metagenome]